MKHCITSAELWDRSSESSSPNPPRGELDAAAASAEMDWGTLGGRPRSRAADTLDASCAAAASSASSRARSASARASLVSTWASSAVMRALSASARASSRSFRVASNFDSQSSRSDAAPSRSLSRVDTKSFTRLASSSRSSTNFSSRAAVDDVTVDSVLSDSAFSAFSSEALSLSAKLSLSRLTALHCSVTVLSSSLPSSLIRSASSARSYCASSMSSCSWYNWPFRSAMVSLACLLSSAAASDAFWVSLAFFSALAHRLSNWPNCCSVLRSRSFASCT
mmetsp:Transcript_29300/g.86802  ORF Transcript_29300/g.86802 Transcript_29300/m.86802 type:complete len:279 (-) Transcript_29300:637-1473(-)